MCLAVPGKIESIDENMGNVNIMGVIKKVNLQLIENPEIGDNVLVHVGFAIQKIDTKYYDYLLNIFKNEVCNYEDK